MAKYTSHPAASFTPNLILLFNHRLTARQEEDAYSSLGINRIILPPVDVQMIWAQVPTDADELTGYLAPVFAWLAAAAQPGDFVLIQGEFGATYLAVEMAFRLSLVPIYSTTRREAMEEHVADDRVEIRHTFSHVRYRKYGL
ncbi:MAG: CRISPR-associated protein Csx20 [Pseudomonadota bacterium]